METGLDWVVREGSDRLRGLRVGLVTHPAAVLSDLTPALAALLAAGVRVTALYGPEHGLEGAAADGAAVSDTLHRRTGLPVFSLYGAHKEPTPAMLEGVDLLLFDMQDVGVRFYTYLSTLWYLLRGAARVGKPVWVLDRPNPLNGVTLEGPLVAPGFESFVGVIPIPIRHGMTLGELARWMNAEYALGADLTVIPLRGWQREQWFDATGRPWVMTSPAMPHLSTVTVYPGMCLLEGTNVSCGRGTALPFELCGAPWLDGEALAQQLNALRLPGVRFRPHAFIPTADKYAGALCYGVQVHVLEREIFHPVTTGLYLLAACRAVAPTDFAFLDSSWEGRPAHLDLLTGSAQVREGLSRGVPVAELVATWEADLAAFAERRRPYLLYP